MNRNKMVFVVGALALGSAWAGVGLSAVSTTGGQTTPNRDYERAVVRMSAPDIAFADVSLEAPEEAVAFVMAADSKTCSQRCSTRCSVGCTTTRGCSSRCKVQTDGCGGASGSGTSTYRPPPPTTAPPASRPPGAGSIVVFSPVTTSLTSTNVKRALIAAGYHLCVSDSMDAMTRDAIFEFQRQNRLVPTGQLDSPTQEALGKILQRIAG